MLSSNDWGNKLESNELLDILEILALKISQGKHRLDNLTLNADVALQRKEVNIKP